MVLNLALEREGGGGGGGGGSFIPPPPPLSSATMASRLRRVYQTMISTSSEGW